MFNIHLLPAGYGDSLLIEYGNRKTESYLLIDGGIHYAYEDVMAAIKEVAPNLKTIDLFVVTHIDTDHIDGAIMMLNDDSFPYKIKEIWFNGWDQISQSDLLGERQGEYLSALIKIKDVPHNTSFLNGVASLKKDNKPFEVEIAGGMKLLLLSPTPKALRRQIKKWEEITEGMHDEDEWYNRVQDLPRYQPDLLGGSDSKEKKPKKKWTSDTSTANGSSIAFLASFEGKSCLFSGDAHSPDLQKAIETHFELKKGECISVDAWKLSHHGSKRNTETGLMDRVMAKNILVTTSGKKFDHPDEEAIDALLEYEDRPLTLCFNYKSEFNEKYAEQNLQHDLDYTAIYPKKNGTAVSIEL